MASISNKVLIIIAAVLALIGWVVALGGVGKLNDICNKAVDVANNNNYYRSNGYNSNNYGWGYTSHKDCSDALRWHWWGIWFTFFVMVAILILTFIGKAEAWATTLQIFSAICVGVTMVDVNITYGARYDAEEAALAGFVIMSIALMLMIIFLGMGSAGVSISVAIATNKTAPERVEKVSPAPKGSEPKGVDNA